MQGTESLMESNPIGFNLDEIGSSLLKCNLDERNLFTYLIMEAHHQKSSDIIDTFAPFIILYLGKQGSWKSIEDIYKGVLDDFNINMQDTILESLLYRMLKKGIIEQELPGHKLSEECPNKKLKELEGMPKYSEEIISILKNYNIYISAEKIKKDLDSIKNIKLNINDLEFILDRLKERGFTTTTDLRYKLSEKGMNEEYINIKNESDWYGSLDDLIKDFSNYYFEETKSTIKDDKINIYIQLFIYKNIKPLMGLINTGKYEEINECCGIGKEFDQFSQEYGTIFCDYVRDCITEGKVKYIETVKSLVLGSIISTVFFSKLKLDKDIFKNIIIYIDTNILFYILGLHFDQFTRPAKLLFNLLKANGAKFKVFDFTIEEAISVFRECITNYDELFVSGIKVNDICHFLRNNNMSKLGISNFILEFKKYIEQEEIDIEVTDINTRTYDCPPNIRRKLKIYKPDQTSIQAQNHDIACIQMIKNSRNQKQYDEIKDCIAILLTADEGLFAFNLLECEHRNMTVPEVFVDRLLTNILWIIDPSQNITLESFFADCLRAGFLNRHLYEAVQDRIKYLHEARKLDESDIFRLTYCGFITTKSFRGIKSKQIDMIDKKLLSNAERAVQEKAQFDQKLKEKDSEIRKLKTEVFASEKDINKLDQQIKNLQKETSEKNLLEGIVSDLKQNISNLQTELANRNKIIKEFKQNYEKDKNNQIAKLKQTHKLAFDKSRKAIILIYIALLIIPLYILYLVYQSETEQVKYLAWLSLAPFLLFLLMSAPFWPDNINIKNMFRRSLYLHYAKNYGLVISYSNEITADPHECFWLDYVGCYPLDLDQWRITDDMDNIIYNFKRKFIFEPDAKRIKIIPGVGEDENTRIYSGRAYLIEESKPKIAYLRDKKLDIVDNI